MYVCSNFNNGNIQVQTKCLTQILVCIKRVSAIKTELDKPVSLMWRIALLVHKKKSNVSIDGTLETRSDRISSCVRLFQKLWPLDWKAIRAVFYLWMMILFA